MLEERPGPEPKVEMPASVQKWLDEFPLQLKFKAAASRNILEKASREQLVEIAFIEIVKTIERDRIMQEQAKGFLRKMNEG